LADRPFDLDRRIGTAERSREVVAFQLRRREVLVEVRHQAGPGGWGSGNAWREPWEARF